MHTHSCSDLSWRMYHAFEKHFRNHYYSCRSVIPVGAGGFSLLKNGPKIRAFRPGSGRSEASTTVVRRTDLLLTCASAPWPVTKMLPAHAVHHTPCMGQS
jgi:hypothetical protein